MRMVDIITKKREGRSLSAEDISFFVQGYTQGTIPDYQASALLMAICLKGMDAKETAQLTMEMAHSGDMVDLSSIPGIKVDKHSTGGVGDKTTLVVAPIVASLGVPVAKMSGGGLGHTGGTVDKLEAIPGYRTRLSGEEFLQLVKEHSISITGQSGNLAPADKKIYALRDATGTVESTALIAASIMSKKIAAGADAIVLDVKAGSGALLTTVEEAEELAREMVSIGESVGRSTVALITNMDVPLGNAVGNSLEVIEAVETLRGKGPEDLTKLCVELAANMLYLAKKGDIVTCRRMSLGALRDGTAFQKFLELVSAQGGDVSFLTHTDKFPSTSIAVDVPAPCAGYIAGMDSRSIGNASMLLGAGRETKDSLIDYQAGIVLHCKTGGQVVEGQTLARLFAEDEEKIKKARKMFLSAFRWSKEPPPPMQFIYKRIDASKLENS